MNDTEQQCCAGCQRFTGDETRHIKECPHYPGSFSQMYDLLKADNSELYAQINQLVEERKCLEGKLQESDREKLYMRRDIRIYREALEWYANSDNYLFNETKLASAWSMNKNIEKKAREALHTTEQ